MEAKEYPELQWNALAVEDAEGILDYISDFNAKAAAELIDEIERKVEALQTQPKMGRAGRVEGTRELVVHKNYIVIYKDDPQVVEVLRVLHAKQNWPN